MNNEELSREDAIRAMLDGETLIGNPKFWLKETETKWNGIRFVWQDDSGIRHLLEFDHLMRKPKPKTRPMTRWECLAWANSVDSFGWFVSLKFGNGSWSRWNLPDYYDYDSDNEHYRRARLLADKSGIDESTIQDFEVEV